MRSETSVVLFGMLEHGHIKRLLPIISGLADAGLRVYAFTMERFREEVEEAGGIHIDLFRGRPLEDADAHSIPIPCRYVSFAGHYAGQIVAEAAELRPALVVHDTFAVIGEVVAKHLDLPRVNVCVGHNHAPGPILEVLRHDPRVAVSADCWKAVKALRERHGMRDASPFSYVTGISPDLNLYCEPPQYLRPDERAPFEPIAFVGSLSERTIRRTPPETSPFGEEAAGKQRVYVSFGTIIWRYYEEAARGALEAIHEAVACLPEIAALVSLGRYQPGEWIRDLELPNLRVMSYVDQWDVLGESSTFITHHGLNSTHEAVFQGVPMISYPFFADQPALARRCQELGLAIPLAPGLRAPVSAADVRAALTLVAAERARMAARLAEARRWELETMAGRSRVIEGILGLIR